MLQPPQETPVPAVFLHVPKTAGSTMRSVFHRCLGDQLLWYRNPGTRRPLDPEHPRAIGDLSSLDQPQAWSGVRLLGGHFPASKLPLALRERRPLLMAVLREPVARIESLYAFIQREQGHVMHEALSSRTLREALELPAFRRQVPQGQLRFLRTTQRPWSAALLAPFPVLIGKHEHLPEFVAAVSRRTGLDLDLADMSTNVSPSGYRDALRQQPGYEEARALIASLTEDESAFLRSFEALYEHEAADLPVEPRPARPRRAGNAVPAATTASSAPVPSSLVAADPAPQAGQVTPEERRAARRAERRTARQAQRREARRQAAGPSKGQAQ